MTTRLMDMAEGLITVLDERLAPEGMDVAAHYVFVARKLHDAEIALAHLDREPGPFDTDNPALRSNDASYALLEAARSMMGFAIRLRSRLTGQHARQAAEPLRVGLRALAAEIPDGDPPTLIARAAHALVISSPAVELADRSEAARAAGLTLDGPIQHLVAEGVLSVLQLAALVQDGDLP